jgi:DNA-binding response OmpR family regulator
MSKLAVDDLCQLFNTLLTMEGWACTVAHNGLTALQSIAIIPPKLMLLDLVMPVLDGFAVLERLPDDSPPVIVVTGAAALTGVHTLTNGMKQKVRRVLVKPVPADELIAAVEALVLPTLPAESIEACA